MTKNTNQLLKTTQRWESNPTTCGGRKAKTSFIKNNYQHRRFIPIITLESSPSPIAGSKYIRKIIAIVISCSVATSRIYQSPQPVHSRHGFLQLLQPGPFLDISALKYSNTFFELCARFPLLRDHFVCLAEELYGKLF